MRIKFWGVRGSLPAAPSPIKRGLEVELLFQRFFESGHTSKDQISEFLRHEGVTNVGGYGSATTSVEVQSGQQRILIDGGSGIRSFGDSLIKSNELKGTFHIFMTHFHWDHLIGLPFFAPHFIRGANIHYYSVDPNLENLIRGKFRKPYFPVPFEQLESNIQFHKLEPRRAFRLNDLSITPYLLDHPDTCWGFRVESGGKSYAHCVDTECTRVSQADLGPDLPLYQNADLIYFDAQYTLPELAEKANWGHSASPIGLDLAYREGAKRILFCHHDPGADTAQIEELVKQTAEYESTALGKYGYPLRKVSWAFAHEGLIVDL